MFFGSIKARLSSVLIFGLDGGSWGVIVLKVLLPAMDAEPSRVISALSFANEQAYAIGKREQA